MQRVPWWKPTLIVVSIILGLLLLYPTFVWQRIPSVDKATLSSARTVTLQQEIDDLKEQKRAAAERDEEEDVLTDQIREKETALRKEKDRLRSLRSRSVHLGLDLQGGLRAVLQVDMDRGASEEDRFDFDRDQTLRSIKNIIDQRIDDRTQGLSEAITQVQGDDRILVQIPGIADESIIYDLIGRTARLDFRAVWFDEAGMISEQQKISQILADIDRNLGETLVAHTEMNDDYGLVVPAEFYPSFRETLESENARVFFPPDYEIVFGKKFGNQAEGEYYPLHLLRESPEMGGTSITDAFPQADITGFGGWRVLIRFDAEGAITFREVTGRLKSRQLAIVLDDIVYSAPRINEEITGGRAEISGRFTQQEAADLASVLRSGNLPADVQVIETNVVGATLGADSIKQSVRAGLIGAGIVLLFMLFYYLLCGAVANFALVLNVFLLVAGLAAFQATLTLPGIAGIVLIIGMAVDANVLIYERIREEQDAGSERSLGALLAKGYGQAFSAILDGNVTTLITAVCLYGFGTGPIKGFAVTLTLGLVISLYTALFVTRTIFEIAITRGWIKRLHTGSLRPFGKSNYDFMKLRFASLAFSGIVIVVGVTVASISGFKFGIEFEGGTEITATFDREVTIDQIRTALPSTLSGEANIQPDHADPRRAFIRVVKLTPEQIVAANEDLDNAVYALMQERAGENPFSTAEEAMSKAFTGDVAIAAFRKNMPENALRIDGTSTRDVSPQVGGEIKEQAFWAVVVSSFLIIIYITWRFQFKYAIASIIALFHDVLVTVSIFAMLGGEFNLPIVAALLTVLGYSMNDTIIVFDRIRENRRLGTLDVQKIVNTSINQTLSRTLLTSGTTLTVLGCQLIFGGPVTFGFVQTLVIGIIVGTYSSIFVASPVLVIWEERMRRKQLSAK